jgi:hypothetical protein
MTRHRNQARTHCQLCNERLTVKNRFCPGLCKLCRKIREQGAEPVYSLNPEMRETAK